MVIFGYFLKKFGIKIGLNSMLGAIHDVSRRVGELDFLGMPPLIGVPTNLVSQQELICDFCL